MAIVTAVRAEMVLPLLTPDERAKAARRREATMQGETLTARAGTRVWSLGQMGAMAKSRPCPVWRRSWLGLNPRVCSA